MDTEVHLKRDALTVASALLLSGMGCHGVLHDPVDPRRGSNEAGPPSRTAYVDGCGDVEVYRSTLRRLNAREYRHSVFDLFGVDIQDVELPPDGLNAHGFDTDGESLTLSEGDAQRYFDAAEATAVRVVQDGTTPFEDCRPLAGAELRACVGSGLDAWFRRAVRRPVEEPTFRRVRDLMAADSSYEQVVQTVVTYTLVSPHFLFHHKPVSPDAYELANRLAFFVWSSAPDSELMLAAADGSLENPEVLAAQAARLMADSRAERFLREFTAQWLSVARLAERADSEEQRLLYEHMKTESETFVYEAIANDRPLSEIIAADFTYANADIAAVYGADATELDAEEFLRFTLPRERKGLLTHASLLVANAPTGVSDPIRRGAWIAEKIMCAAPPPPPADIPELPVQEQGGTIRDALEQHRSDPACAGCHALLDPYGLALEVFDGAGVHRDAYSDGGPIDPSGELVTGESFQDVSELTEIIAASGAFEECLSESLAIYGLGRELSSDERCVVDRLVEELARLPDTGVRFSDVVAGLIQSPLFRL